MTGNCFTKLSKRLGRIFFGGFFLFLLGFPSILLAQGYFGTVSGELTDPSGAVVPGAKVVITDVAKGFTFAATSDSAGRYLLTSVPPGVYTLTVTVEGFQREVRTEVKITVSENATANFRLKVATATQSVEVQAQTQALATEDAVTGQVVNRKFINDLPLVDRYVLDFVMLAPGMNAMSDQNSVGDTGTNFVSNGSRGASADILMDGASITNFEPNGGITAVTYTPSAEAVEEFKVEQTNFSAEYGFTGSSVVNMITRSGGNSFHGGVYDFIRNSMTDANNWFANAAEQPISPLHRHNYGGTLGGPIKKDKLFFFFDWDGTRDTSMATAQAGVPTDAERQGNFGGLCAAAGGTFRIPRESACPASKLIPRDSFGILIRAFITLMFQTRPRITLPIPAIWVLAHTAAPLSRLTTLLPTQVRAIPTLTARVISCPKSVAI